jgi:hypothetical protein
VLQLLADPSLRAQLDDGDLRSYTPFHVACAGALPCAPSARGCCHHRARQCRGWGCGVQGADLAHAPVDSIRARVKKMGLIIIRTDSDFPSIP